MLFPQVFDCMGLLYFELASIDVFDNAVVHCPIVLFGFSLKEVYLIIVKQRWPYTSHIKTWGGE